MPLNKETKLNVQADYEVKMKESEKRDKYEDLARELKKLWNMKVTVIPIVIGALSIVTKELVQGLEELKIREWVETIQTLALNRSAGILSRVLATCHSDSSEKLSANASVKNSQMSKMIIWKYKGMKKIHGNYSIFCYLMAYQLSQVI